MSNEKFGAPLIAGIDNDKFEKNKYYFMLADSGGYHPFLINIDMCWKLGAVYIPHDNMMEISTGKKFYLCECPIEESTETLH